MKRLGSHRDPSTSLRSARDDGGERTQEILKKNPKPRNQNLAAWSKTDFAGDYHSVFKGRGMNFEEVRDYQRGDEIRTIDWNVTARLGSPVCGRSSRKSVS